MSQIQLLFSRPRRVALLCAIPVLLSAGGDTPRWSNPESREKPQVVERYGQLPLYFEPNLGQTDGRVQFLARTGGYTLFLTGGEAVMVLSRSAAPAKDHRVHESQRVEQAVVRIKLQGSEAKAPVMGLDRQPGISAYFIGNDPAKWRPEVPHYGRVEYKGVYPGVDLVYYGSQQQVEYDFVVGPGADPSRIKLAFEGTDRLRLDASGDLVLTTGLGEIKQRKPRVWQQIGEKRVEVEARYRLEGKRVGIELAAYNKAQPLVIDPVLGLVYSTFLGGSGGDEAQAIAVDSTGAAYITGLTQSKDFPSVNSYQSSQHGLFSVFVTKLNAYNGSGPVTLAYSTYLSGSGDTGVADEEGLGIAVDANGAAYVAGSTGSSTFPTVNAFQSGFPSTVPYGTSAFVTKLNPNTGAGPVTLAYSTYLGGSSRDVAYCIAVDAAGAAYVAGAATSTDFPTSNAYQGTLRLSNGPNAFVTKLNTYAGTGSVTLAYSTYLGGSNGKPGVGDIAYGIAVDATGAACVAGTASSADFPTSNAYQATLLSPNGNAFVTKLNSYGGNGPVTVAYSTFLGGTTGDFAYAIAVDAAGGAYIAGQADSIDFPIANSHWSSLQSLDGDAFVSKLSPYSGNGPVTLAYSTYLGGSGYDSARGIAVDGNGAAYVTGFTSSLNFPTANAYQSSLGFSWATNAFVTKLNAYGGSGLITLAYSTYFGGLSDNVGLGIAVDRAGAPYVAGETASPGFTVANAYQASLGGSFKSGAYPTTAFVFELTAALVPPPFGSFDTPVDNASVAGAIAVTGWALGDLQPVTVDIWRDPLAGELTGYNHLVFIGNAVFVNGARPDIATAYPDYLSNTSAGWGLQILTNELPTSNGSGPPGNGTYRIHAIAHGSGTSTELGVKTITVNNGGSLLPFGTIDTPGQGATVSGNAYVNFGWALTPRLSIIPVDGSTITVYIDGSGVGHPVYNQPRSDIQAAFPRYQNTDGAVGYYIIDTTKLSNGVHSIAWSVTDNNGHAQGIGSRYFTVQN